MVLALALASGCAGGGGVVVTKEPPAPQEEQRPPRPNVDVFWMTGHWAWDAGVGHYYWVPGSWAKERPGRFWRPGYWEPVQDGGQRKGWRWIEERWTREEDLRGAPPPR